MTSLILELIQDIELHKSDNMRQKYTNICYHSSNINNSYNLARQHMDKNRYCDVFANDMYCFKSPQNNLSYVNASIIDIQELQYNLILAQGPLKKYMCDFWKMVWISQSEMIISLSKNIENDRIKYDDYFNDLHQTQYEYFVIDVVEINIVDDFYIRKIKIFNSNLNQYRYLNHFHYTNWVDTKTPDIKSLLRFMRIIMDNYVTIHPKIIHCSAGIGRTGTLAVLMYIWKIIIFYKHNNQMPLSCPKNKDCIYQIINILRGYRDGVVQNFLQLNFCYSMSLEIIKYLTNI